jgi:hypothetical protein
MFIDFDKRDEINARCEAWAASQGWTMDPDDADQWKHPAHPGEAYWDAIDIPGANC